MALIKQHFPSELTPNPELNLSYPESSIKLGVNEITITFNLGEPSHSARIYRFNRAAYPTATPKELVKLANYLLVTEISPQNYKKTSLYFE